MRSALYVGVLLVLLASATAMAIAPPLEEHKAGLMLHAAKGGSPG